jgi:hypothetical protein
MKSSTFVGFDVRFWPSRHRAPPHDLGRKQDEADMNRIYEYVA